MAARVSSAGRVAYSLRTAVLWLTYFVIGLTNYVVILIPFWEIVFLSFCGLSEPHATSALSFAFGVGCAFQPSAKRESQPIGLILLRSQDPFKLRVPCRSCDRDVSRSDGK